MDQKYKSWREKMQMLNGPKKEYETERIKKKK